MFGYVKVCKAELRMREYEEYKAVYCTLCRVLGEEYGFTARGLLSYDACFYVLLRDCAESGEIPEYKAGRCRFNPLKKCNYQTNCGESYRAAAALTVLMSYQKARDNITDGKTLKRIAAHMVSPYLRGKYKKAKARYPQFAEVVEQAMTAQASLETAGCDSTDRAADPSAKALSEIFGAGIKSETQKRIIERVAYCVGRFVYLLDAYDDLEEDLKNGTYNPFLQKYRIRDPQTLKDAALHENILRSLHMTANEAAVSFHLLTGEVHRGILENILQDGLETACTAVRKKYEEVNESV